MKIYDFMHAYQPFFSERIPSWVIENLEEVFLPLSRSFAKGLCKHTIQIQGWTLESWDSNEKTKPLFEEFHKNVVQGIANGSVEIGFSAFSHPILPLLSNRLIEMQIEEDYKTVLKYFGEPKVFFPPEGAIDQRVLNIVSEMFPEMSIMIPDKAISLDITSEFFNFKRNKIAAFSVIVKDALMGAPYFERPPAFIPNEVEWASARKALKSPESLTKFLKQLEIKEGIISRDMENGESRNALREFGPRTKDIPSLVNGDFEKLFISEGHVEPGNDIEEISPASWEPLSNESDPYPFWSPSGEYYLFLSTYQKNLISSWLELVSFYDELIVNDETLFKETAPIIISCFPWHFTTPLEWDNNIGFSEYILNECIKSRFPMLLKDESDKKRYEEIISELEINLKELQRLKARLINQK